MKTIYNNIRTTPIDPDNFAEFFGWAGYAAGFCAGYLALPVTLGFNCGDILADHYNFNQVTENITKGVMSVGAGCLLEFPGFVFGTLITGPALAVVGMIGGYSVGISAEGLYNARKSLEEKLFETEVKK